MSKEISDIQCQYHAVLGRWRYFLSLIIVFLLIVSSVRNHRFPNVQLLQSSNLVVSNLGAFKLKLGDFP